MLVLLTKIGREKIIPWVLFLILYLWQWAGLGMPDMSGLSWSYHKHLILPGVIWQKKPHPLPDPCLGYLQIVIWSVWSDLLICIYFKMKWLLKVLTWLFCIARIINIGRFLNLRVLCGLGIRILDCLLCLPSCFGICINSLTLDQSSETWFWFVAKIKR